MVCSTLNIGKNLDLSILELLTMRNGYFLIVKQGKYKAGSMKR